jgi:hypothetical protein
VPATQALNCTTAQSCAYAGQQRQIERPGETAGATPSAFGGINDEGVSTMADQLRNHEPSADNQNFGNFLK